MNIIKNISLVLAAVFTILLLPYDSSALLIGTSRHSGSMSLADSGQSITSFDVTPFFMAGSANPPPTPWYSPFGTVRIDPGSVGSRFFADRSVPHFTDAVSLLTNGIDDIIGHETTYNYALPPSGIYYSGSWMFKPESRVLTGAGFNGTDFYGSMIDTIILSVDSFRSFHAADPMGMTRLYTEYAYTLTYEQTPIPEPSTILLLGSGLLGAGIFGKARKRS